ncbi:hypothetical protein E05_12640 [Plautia stali symbiont]|nr:hypothetical protein E05_12640 [Plautia stali symbiont]
MAHFHWRAIFLALTLVTLVLLFGMLKLASAPRARHDSTPQPSWLTLLPFCGMALANGAIYPIVVSSALAPFPQATGKAAGLQNLLQLGLCFLASLIVSAGLQQALLHTTLVMVATVILAWAGFLWQRSASAQSDIAHASRPCEDNC